MLLVSMRTTKSKTSARLLVLHLGELGIDDIAVVLLAGFGLALLLARSALRAGLRLGLLIGVHLLAELLRGLRERLRLRLDLGLVLGFQRALGVLDRGLDFLLLGGLDLIAVFLERLPHRVYQCLRGIPRVHQLERLAVF